MYLHYHYKDQYHISQNSYLILKHFKEMIELVKNFSIIEIIILVYIQLKFFVFN